MQIKTRINLIVGVALCLSIMGNIAFIHHSLCNNRQARQSSDHLESELSSAAGFVSSATSTIISGNDKLTDVTTGLSASTDTAGAIKDNASTSLERCGDIEQTIKELRAEIKDLENNGTGCSSSSSSSDSNLGNH